MTRGTDDDRTVPKARYPLRSRPREAAPRPGESGEEETTAPSNPPLVVSARGVAHEGEPQAVDSEMGETTLPGMAPLLVASATPAPAPAPAPAPESEPIADVDDAGDSEPELFDKPPAGPPMPSAPSTAPASPPAESMDDWLESLGSGVPPPVAAKPRHEPTMTRFARAAMDFTMYFEAMFGDERVVGSCPRKPVLRTPEGGTTEGGIQSVQHLVLEPEVEGHPAYTVGWINTANHTAMLRTHACLRQMHERRFGSTSFGVDAASYKRLFDQVRSLCEEQEIAIRLELAPPASPQAATNEAARVERSHRTDVVIGIILLVGMLGAAAAVAYQYFF